MRPWHGVAVLVVALVAGLSLPYQSSYVRLLITEIMVFGLLAVSFDLLFGFAGLLSVGQALYFGVGAYLMAFAAQRYGLEVPAAILCALAGVLVLAVATGFVCLRVRGHNFLIITIIFSTAAYFLATNWSELTGGDDGLVLESKVFRLTGETLTNTGRERVVLACFLAAFGATFLLLLSPFGRVLRAIKENDRRAEFLGYDTARIKLAAFCWAGALAGLAGALYAILFRHVHTGLLHWIISGDALIWSFFGGVGTLAGPVLGVALLLPFEEVISSAVGLPKLFTGILLVLMVLVNRKGILGMLAWLRSKVR
jgi:branched-chain amino acid transport system permease protein